MDASVVAKCCFYCDATIFFKQGQIVKKVSYPGEQWQLNSMFTGCSLGSGSCMHDCTSFYNEQHSIGVHTLP